MSDPTCNSKSLCRGWNLMLGISADTRHVPTFSLDTDGFSVWPSWSLGRFYFSLLGSRMWTAEAIQPPRDWSLAIKTFTCCSVQLESSVFLSPPDISECLGAPLTFWISQLNSPQSSRFPPSDSLRCQTCDKGNKDTDMRTWGVTVMDAETDQVKRADKVPKISDVINTLREHGFMTATTPKHSVKLINIC